MSNFYTNMATKFNPAHIGKAEMYRPRWVTQLPTGINNPHGLPGPYQIKVNHPLETTGNLSGWDASKMGPIPQHLDRRLLEGRVNDFKFDEHNKQYRSAIARHNYNKLQERLAKNGFRTSGLDYDRYQRMRNGAKSGSGIVVGHTKEAWWNIPGRTGPQEVRRGAGLTSRRGAGLTSNIFHSFTHNFVPAWRDMRYDLHDYAAERYPRIFSEPNRPNAANSTSYLTKFGVGLGTAVGGLALAGAAGLTTGAALSLKDMRQKVRDRRLRPPPTTRKTKSGGRIRRKKKRTCRA